MYNDEFNNNDMYRFTNREVPRDDYAPAPRQENTYTAPVKKQGFFHRTWVKVTALVLACAVVVLRTMLDDTYKSADDIRKYTGMVVLASIPLADAGEQPKEKNEFKRRTKRFANDVRRRVGGSSGRKA